ncbi:MAG: FAD-dependent oxidoreductase [Desulfovibrionaceae bacterium]|nr:FAD-dependent oxidoreductase [Desulfovibrionaceae bacterium]
MPPKYSREITRPIVLGESLQEQFRTSPCEIACPAGNPIQKMTTLVEQGKFAEALRYLYAKNPFPGMTGRTCPHFCQSACNRAKKDGCVRTRELERAAVDFGGSIAPFTRRQATGKHVSIIGGGPAGLSSAYFLALLGHDVTVYEAAPLLGGMPRHAVPAFRLPRDIVDREVGRVLACGVHARVNTAVGRDISFAAVREASDAVIIATGAPLEKTMDVAGAEYALKGVDILHRAAMGERPALGKRVVVIGGGGTACDCASTARRLGADEVSIFYRREEKDMPAPLEDTEQARAEGVHIHACRVVTAVHAEQGVVTGLTYHDVRDCRKDAEGRMTCAIVPGSEQFYACDSVIFAVGMETDLAFLHNAAPQCTRRGWIVTDAAQAASIEGLFAAGDVASGPASITQAIGQGRRAAFGVHAFLTGEKARVYVIDDDNSIAACDEMAADTPPHVVEYEEIYGVTHYADCAPHEQAVSYALSLEESRAGYTREQAMAEAARCFHCGHCKQCGTCVDDCPGYVLGMRGAAGQERPQVIHGEECWHCANCRTSCPCGAIAFTFPLFMQV